MRGEREVVVVLRYDVAVGVGRLACTNDGAGGTGAIYVHLASLYASEPGAKVECEPA